MTLLQHQDVLSKLGYSELNPLQRHAVSEGFLESPRTLVCAPTASGKTLLALLAMVTHFASSNKPVFYVVPLRALASEKHREFKQSLASFDKTVGLSTGDFDSSSSELGGFDVLIMTSEKLDSLLRHDKTWLQKAGLFIFDEIHLLADGSRGATLEMVLTKVKRSEGKILGLSATVSNAPQLAQWLGAKLIQSDYRPTPLVIGLCDGEQLHMEDGPVLDVTEPAVLDLAKLALKEKNGKGQALFFVATRPSTQALAKLLATVVRPRLSAEELAQCKVLSEKVLKALPVPTHQCRLLAECVAQGVAFHHAGCEGTQRALVEDAFKHTRCIKIIAATTTLAVGLDMPASWVVVRDLKRFSGGFSDYMSKMEVAQMTGRAGRPRFDTKGVGILMCQPRELRAVRDKYVFGKLEDLYSQLSSEPTLRFHALALVASGYAGSFEKLFEFFHSTFYAHQYGDVQQLLAVVEKVVNQLKDMDFIREKKGLLLATPAGKRVAELYVDPLSAHGFIQSMGRKLDDMGFLMVLQKATESRPLLTVKRAEEQILWDEWFESVAGTENSAGSDDIEALQRFKGAKLLQAWITEKTEDQIYEGLDVPPGVVHAKVKIQEWLAYSYSELAYLLNQSTALSIARPMRKRLQYGVKGELLPLISIRGVGRVRARRLFDKGIHTKEQAEALGDEKLKELWKDGGATNARTGQIGNDQDESGLQTKFGR
ncbi:DEAD/DEAH box helicase [Candidatus Micrarchaeota archaeon]|nr:DEAD/DEAH box helicase [Candidatus Micrarchaeota archaeon]